jgi:hypothetical protein
MNPSIGGRAHRPRLRLASAEEAKKRGRKILDRITRLTGLK